MGRGRMVGENATVDSAGTKAHHVFSATYGTTEVAPGREPALRLGCGGLISWSISIYGEVRAVPCGTPAECWDAHPTLKRGAKIHCASGAWDGGATRRPAKKPGGGLRLRGNDSTGWQIGCEESGLASAARRGRVSRLAAAWAEVLHRSAGLPWRWGTDKKQDRSGFAKTHPGRRRCRLRRGENRRANHETRQFSVKPVRNAQIHPDFHPISSLS